TTKGKRLLRFNGYEYVTEKSPEKKHIGNVKIIGQKNVTFAFIHRNEVLPVCFVLLANKTQITYQQMINQISIICPLWLPQTVMVDFEKAPINVLGDAFPNIQMTGCFFHFRQTIHRKIQELGMQNDYNTNARFARQAHAFGELSDELPLAFKPLLLYFQQTYIGRTRPYGRAKPQSDLAFWNINVRITDGLVRTTNGAESWHARLKS
ncbi:unnamed protein product, partial [Didymodactylos carnosus]